jgi:hypothetical protein
MEAIRQERLTGTKEAHPTVVPVRRSSIGSEEETKLVI